MKKRAGFTLIELMVVVVIIGLLISMAYPVYNNYIAKVKLSEFKNVLPRVVALYNAYYQEHDTYVTPTHDIREGNADIGFELSAGESRFTYSAAESENTVVVTATLKKDVGKYKAGMSADMNEKLEKNTVTKDLPW
jgi:type IV pilus assembly protein PilE